MVEQLQIDSSEWAAFVDASAAAQPFHLPAWASMIARCYRFDAFALVLRDTSGRCVGGVPVIELRSPLSRRRRWSSLPFTDVCPALVELADGVAFAEAVDRFRLAHGIREFEIGGAVGDVPGMVSSRYVQHVLALEQDPEAVAQRYRSSVRRNIRTARSAGLRVRRSESERDVVEIFYPMQVMTRRRLGLPPQPLRFFRALWDDVLSAGLGHLTIVEGDAGPVAAAVFLSYNGTVVYKYGASDPRAWGLRPNNLLFAEEIAAACLNGCTTFHFGRTDVADVGLRRFKVGWGAHEEPLESVWFGDPRGAERPAPPGLLRAIVRVAPPFVARSVGEVLYRFAA